MARELSVSVSHEGDFTIVQIAGPVDSETIDAFKEKLDPAFAVKGSLVLMDCRELSYLNSRAIGLLMKYYRQLAFSRGRMALYGVNKKLVRTLDLLHIGKEVTVLETREEAIAALGTKD